MYAPTRKQEQKVFYRDLQHKINTNYMNTNIILAGDFNLADVTGLTDNKLEDFLPTKNK